MDKNNILRGEVKDWFEQAQEDLKTAKYNLEGRIYYASAFFSQQAVEKALKAYHIYKKTGFRKTHSVNSLAKGLGLSKEFLSKIVELEEIHRIARYPGISEKIPSKEIGKDDAINFYNIAQEVLEWVEVRLK